jgi:hypothetical protein
MAYPSNLVRSEGDPKVLRSGPGSLGTADRLGRALGWFSLALGLAELAAPGRFTRALGLDGKEALVRAFGAREIVHGVLALSPEHRTAAWSRVAGDGLDIAALLTALRPDNPKRGNAMIALALVLGVTAADLAAAQAVTARHARGRGERRSYRDRSGFPQGVAAARGAARDFLVPADMRAPPALVAADAPAP